MGYSIIFETKICKLENGDIIHFSLQGCNNDTHGRDRGEFIGRYYTPKEWENNISKWENTLPDGEGWDLKIGSRFCNYSDYGKHLRTMTKRAKTFDELKTKNLCGTVFDGIAFIAEDGKETLYSHNDPTTNKIINGVLHGTIEGKCYARRHNIYTEADIIDALKNKRTVEFYIGK
jgi:hypothetical protein